MELVIRVNGMELLDKNGNFKELNSEELLTIEGGFDYLKGAIATLYTVGTVAAVVYAVVDPTPIGKVTGIASAVGMAGDTWDYWVEAFSR